ncbi:hypothetical protein [Pseudarthrobacter sp. ATCC 49987]|uniref:hypothetical protein n=1 Tax=Pseudarthrobacter sp. ATCC 49987 TaxID=2698204 RepID=UPI001369BC17|nr:hypothetical protein [Pseudarthrobacter sp. ATCC 49987]
MNGRTQSHLSSGVRTVFLILVATLMAGCTAPQQPPVATSSAPPATQAPAPVAESFAKYEALRAEMIAALEAKMPDISWTVDKPATLAASKDGRCLLTPQTMKSSADVVEPSNHFADIFAAGDPVLARHGFPAFGGTDAVPGGWVVARSTDADGATLTIESKSPAYLRISVPVDSPTCNADEIPPK